MKHNTSKSLREHLKEVNLVEPNDLGVPFLTKIYRKINIFFKNAPFIFIIPIAILSAIGFIYIFIVFKIKKI